MCGADSITRVLNALKTPRWSGSNDVNELTKRLALGDFHHCVFVFELLAAVTCF